MAAQSQLAQIWVLLATFESAGQVLELSFLMAQRRPPQRFKVLRDRLGRLDHKDRLEPHQRRR
jgi:hypothetical protein